MGLSPSSSRHPAQAEIFASELREQQNWYVRERLRLGRSRVHDSNLGIEVSEWKTACLRMEIAVSSKI